MAGRKNAAKAETVGAQASAPVAELAPDREKLSERQLAKAVLAGDFRPRVGEMRRLAEAVLTKAAKKPKGKGKKPKSSKLAKIPQKKK